MGGEPVLIGWAVPDPADAGRLAASSVPRLHRFARPADAARYATVRRVAAELLRRVGDEADIWHHCVRCGPADHGQPVVLRPAGWYLSMAHAGERCVAAVARRPVGVDVEDLTALAGLDAAGGLLTMAARFTTDADRRGWARASPAGRVAAFAATWVRYEARSKTDGLGLHRPDGQAPPDVPTEMVDVGPGFCAAVAVRTDGAGRPT